MDTPAKLVEIARRLYDKNLNAAVGGNVSIRQQDGIAITPAGINKGFMIEGDVVVVDLNGTKLRGAGEPSSEGKMHYEIYRQRPDVQAVIHAHPPFAVAFALAHRDIPDDVLPEVAINLGRVPCLPYVTPSTMELARGGCPRACPRQRCHHGESWSHRGRGRPRAGLQQDGASGADVHVVDPCFHPWWCPPHSAGRDGVLCTALRTAP